jgi:hypothetical protein
MLTTAGSATWVALTIGDNRAGSGSLPKSVQLELIHAIKKPTWVSFDLNRRILRGSVMDASQKQVDEDNPPVKQSWFGC